jgi:glutathione S-transferase
MNCRARKEPRDRGPEVAVEVERVVAIWEEARREFGSGGPFLFGSWTLADAFFAPLVSRFRTYAVPLKGEAAAYAESVLSMPAVSDWMRKAEAEEHVHREYDAAL